MLIGDTLAKLLPGENLTPIQWQVLVGGHPITSVAVDDACVITLEGGGKLTIKDDGQSCCESRYMSCDDDLASLAGGQLVDIDMDAGGDTGEAGDWGDCHETMFVKVRTTKGDFTLVTHNEHNGYYGGFSLKIVWDQG